MGQRLFSGCDGSRGGEFTQSALCLTHLDLKSGVIQFDQYVSGFDLIAFSDIHFLDVASQCKSQMRILSRGNDP